MGHITEIPGREDPGVWCTAVFMEAGSADEVCRGRPQLMPLFTFLSLSVALSASSGKAAA